MPSALGKNHPALKDLRRLREPGERRRQGLFLVEGVRLLEEASASPCFLERLFYRTDRLKDERVARLVSRHSGRATELAAESLSKLSETEQDQGLIAVLRIPSAGAVADLKSLLVLEAVSDPGNVGTLIRAARAAGVGGVALLGGVEAFNSKVVRSSAGAIFYLPVFQGLSVDSIVEAGFTLLAAVARDGEDYYECALPSRPAWAMGGEADGLSASLLAAGPVRVTLPMEGDCESLNVAMAGTLMMFDWRRRVR
ncbi:unnamed protein product [Phaeothamnion confervicola]